MADKTALETIKGIIEANGGTSDAETIVPALEDLGEVIAAGGGSGGMKVIRATLTGSVAVLDEQYIPTVSLTNAAAIFDALDAIAEDPAKAFEYGLVLDILRTDNGEESVNVTATSTGSQWGFKWVEDSSEYPPEGKMSRVLMGDAVFYAVSGMTEHDATPEKLSVSFMRSSIGPDGTATFTPPTTGGTTPAPAPSPQPIDAG
jgi:hypothetical protein